MMTIFVETTVFNMHRGLLCFHSEYFKNLLNGPFKEGGSNAHTLSNVSSDTFTMFYNWMYTGRVVDCDQTADADLEFEDILNVYVFADFHMIPQLKNRALELFWQHMTKCWEVDLNLSSQIYDLTSESDPLRKLHIDIIVETHELNDWHEDQERMPKEAIVDLFDSYRKLCIAPGSMPGLDVGTSDWILKTKKKFCKRYHEHADNSRYDEHAS
jgi:hypothetical protein